MHAHAYANTNTYIGMFQRAQLPARPPCVEPLVTQAGRLWPNVLIYQFSNR